MQIYGALVEKKSRQRSSIAFLQEESGKTEKTHQAGAGSSHLGCGTLEGGD